MTDIRLSHYARLLGANTVIGMAQKAGLTRPPPPISVLHLIDLFEHSKPLAPVDLQPQNGSSVNLPVGGKTNLFFRDPGRIGTLAAAVDFEVVVTQSNGTTEPPRIVPNPLPPNFTVVSSR